MTTYSYFSIAFSIIALGVSITITLVVLITIRIAGIVEIDNASSTITLKTRSTNA